MCILDATVEIFETHGFFDGMFFFTSSMQKSFASFPELVCIDGTYKLLKLHLTVVLLIVIDGSGNSEVIGVGLLAAETYENYMQLIQALKKHNYDSCMKIQCFMSDKDATERRVLSEVFPNISLQICRFHVLQIFKRTLASMSLNKSKKQCLEILEKLVYANSQEQYDIYKEQLRKSATNQLWSYFNDNWDNIRNQWSSYGMTETNFDNLTNNRLESLNQKFKML